MRRLQIEIVDKYEPAMLWIIYCPFAMPQDNDTIQKLKGKIYLQQGAKELLRRLRLDCVYNLAHVSAALCITGTATPCDGMHTFPSIGDQPYRNTTTAYPH
jgi:hypothetical protein